MEDQSEYVHNAFTFVSGLHAHSVLSSENSASELSWKFIKSAFIVGWVGCTRHTGLWYVYHMQDLL